MTDSRPQDGEPASFAEKTKTLYRKHRRKIHAVVGTVGTVALAVAWDAIKQAAEQSGSEGVEAVEEEVEDRELTPAAEAKSQPRSSVTPHVRNLAEGRNASPEKRAQYKEETGEELAPGKTWVHRREGEDPGEAAA
ncbi:hypothetical protein ACGFY6_30140 [Streptomyces sp. NPDC048387]|uniref:hypothetical protein n=1 Tax=Streptomyces sp. NPDC048387 TaxID=3365542 RepID=UPI00371536C7